MCVVLRALLIPVSSAREKLPRFRGLIPDAGDDPLGDAFFRRFERPQQHVRVGERHQGEGVLRQGGGVAGDGAGDERVLVLQGELHGGGGVEGAVGLEGEALHEIGVAVLAADAQAGAVDLTAGEHLDAGCVHVEVGYAVAHRAVAQAHEGTVGVGERHPGGAGAGHVGEVVEGEPVEAGVRGRIVAAFWEQPGADDGSYLFMPTRRGPGGGS